MSHQTKGGGYLATADLYNLDVACKLIHRAFDKPPYMVGSAMERPDFRDVDVRLILDDPTFDRLFDSEIGSWHSLSLWELLSLALGDYLRQRTGLPIDFQIQRQTEANEKHPKKPRNPLGMSRRYAGGGDATPPPPPGSEG